MGLRETMLELKRLVITEKLLECGGNVSACARKLEVSRTTLDRLRKELVIDVPKIRKYINRNYKYKLTLSQEQHLKELLTNGIDVRSLMIKYNVCKQLVYAVRNGRRRSDDNAKANSGRHNDISGVPTGKSRFETCIGSNGFDERRFQ